MLVSFTTVHSNRHGIAAIQAVITLVLVVMSFVLGFIVGGQRASHQGELANQQPTSLEEILKRELAQQQGDVEKAKEFKFYKNLKKETVPTAKRKPKPDKVAKQPPVNPTPPVAATAAKKEATNVAQELAPQQSPDTAVKTLYTLQVGSFRTLESANRLLSDLKEKQVEGFISRAKIEGKGEWFRVRVGQFQGQEEAARASRDLQSQTGKSSLITKLDLK